MALAQYKYKDDIHRCFRCGYCKFPGDWSDVTNCPAYARFRMESYSTGGRLWLIRAWVNGEIQWSENLGKIVYACAACNNCVEKCPLSFSDDIVNMVIAAKNEMVELGLLPAPVKTYLKNVQLHGNPYGLPARRRGAWMEGLDIEPYSGQEFLYYVGCEGAYDTRAQQAARALARVLRKAGLSFGVLGNEETSDGNEVELLGEDGLTEMLAAANIATFRKQGAKKSSPLPHALNAIKNIYPRLRRYLRSAALHPASAGSYPFRQNQGSRKRRDQSHLSRSVLPGALEQGVQRAAQGAQGSSGGGAGGNATQPQKRPLLRWRRGQFRHRRPGRQ
jgi:Fe-S oxidoreductase